MDKEKQMSNPSKIYDIEGEYKRQLKAKKANLAQLKKRGISLFFSLDLLDSIDLYLIPFMEKGKYGFINKRAQIIVEPIYDDIKGSFFNEDNYVAVKKGNLWSAINSKGEELLPFSYSLILHSSDSSLITCNNSGWSVIDLSNLRTVVETGIYEIIEHFKFGFARVKKNGKWGIINAQGELVLDTKYETLYPWFEWNEPTTKIKETPNSDEVIIWLNELNKK